MIRFSLRIPAGLPERVTAQAAADQRSLNSEILHLLEVDLAAPGQTPDGPAAIRLSLPRYAGNRIPPWPEGRGILRESR
ncbi:Arc family DNA-binding protein [Streptomyces montanus]|uniref:Arc family DNA-binding protein n=1 Tax=Streptomyces montanus TaxID=2580423 RepID=A0A5R9FGD6_9ACTN|nr:Arc family DNA-binding protein [Streptomyces montanus]